MNGHRALLELWHYLATFRLFYLVTLCVPKREISKLSERQQSDSDEKINCGNYNSILVKKKKKTFGLYFIKIQSLKPPLYLRSAVVKIVRIYKEQNQADAVKKLGGKISSKPAIRHRLDVQFWQ